MFRCEKCEKSADRPIRVVTERKMVTHKDGAEGSQIVKEVNVCANCLESTPEAHKPERVVLEKAPLVHRALFEDAAGVE
jgi:hypothetical protein